MASRTLQPGRGNQDLAAGMGPTGLGHQDAAAQVGPSGAHTHPNFHHLRGAQYIELCTVVKKGAIQEKLNFV